MFDGRIICPPACRWEPIAGGSEGNIPLLKRSGFMPQTRRGGMESGQSSGGRESRPDWQAGEADLLQVDLTQGRDIF